MYTPCMSTTSITCISIKKFNPPPLATCYNFE